MGPRLRESHLLAHSGRGGEFTQPRVHLLKLGMENSCSTHRQRFAVIPDIFSGRAVLVPEESPAGEVFRLRAPDHPEKRRKEMENVA